MLNNRKITLRVSENDFRKIEQIRDGRTITQFFRDLLKSAVEKEKTLSVSEKLDEVLKKIEDIKEQNTKKTPISWWKSLRKCSLL